MQEMRDAGKVGCRKGSRHERSEEGEEEWRKAWIK